MHEERLGNIYVDSLAASCQLQCIQFQHHNVQKHWKKQIFVSITRSERVNEENAYL